MAETKSNVPGLPNDYLPSDSEVQKYLDVWDQLDDYVCHEVALTSIFEKYPQNTEVDEVLIKCVTLNAFYSAGVRGIDLLPLAKHIVSLNIDEQLQQGDLSVVNKITNCKGLSNYYSFASKYCNWHNPHKYPIYDQYVDDVIWALKRQYNITSFNFRYELKDYRKFRSAVTEICSKFSLSKVYDNNVLNFKLADRYLWLVGKVHYAIGKTVDDIKRELTETLLKVTVKISLEASVEIHTISKSKEGSIKVSVNGSVATNTKEALRKIAQIIGFSYLETWNTRQFGKNLIEYIKTNNITQIKQ